METPFRDAFVVRNAALSWGQWLCFLTILFATGDIWPSIDVGFTLRLSQILLLLATTLTPVVIFGSGIRRFPGWQWLAGFITWIILTAPPVALPRAHSPLCHMGRHRRLDRLRVRAVLP
jgi:hypothetical protein